MPGSTSQSEQPQQSNPLPKVFLAVPTGAIKEYSTPQMIASIKNIDYPPDKLTVYFAVTLRGKEYGAQFVKQIKGLIRHANLPFHTEVVTVCPSDEEKLRWGQYYAVICNLHALRKIFLDGDWDYFWLLGGDNPPSRHMLRGLLKIGSDISSAIIMQRPNRGRDLEPPTGMPEKHDPYPMFWVYDWTLSDMHKRMDLEPELKEAVRDLWINLPQFRLVITEKKLTVYGTSFGSGCSLIKRKVLENIGYYLTNAGYASEDIMFIQHAHAYGFTTGINLDLHCSHFDPNGAIY